MSETEQRSGVPGSMTDVREFLENLDGGVFEQKVGTILSNVALGVMLHNKSGEVTLSFKLKQIGSGQVGIAHKIAYTEPTKNGEIKENHTTQTPMHVGRGGKMTFFPDNQLGLFEKKVPAETE